MYLLKISGKNYQKGAGKNINKVKKVFIVNALREFVFFKDFNSSFLVLLAEAFEEKFGKKINLKILEKAVFVFDVISAGKTESVLRNYKPVLKNFDIESFSSHRFYKKLGWQEKLFPFIVYEMYVLFEKNPSLIKENEKLLKRYFSVKFEKGNLYKDSAEKLQEVFFTNFILKTYKKSLRAKMLKSFVRAGGDKNLRYLTIQIIACDRENLLTDSFTDGSNFFYYTKNFQNSYSLNPGKAYKDFSGPLKRARYTDYKTLKNFLRLLDEAVFLNRGDAFLGSCEKEKLGEISKTFNAIEKITGVKIERTENRAEKFLIKTDYILKNLPLVASKIMSLDEFIKDEEKIRGLMREYIKDDDFLFLSYLSFFVFLNKDSQKLKNHAPFAHGMFRVGKIVSGFFEESGLTEKIKESFLFQNGFFYWDVLFENGYMKKNFYKPFRVFFLADDTEDDRGQIEEINNMAESMLTRIKREDPVCMFFLYNGFSPLFSSFLNKASQICKKNYDLQLIEILNDFKWEKLTDFIYKYKYAFNSESPVYSNGGFEYIENMFRFLSNGRPASDFLKKSLLLGFNLFFLKDREKVSSFYGFMKNKLEKEENDKEKDGIKECVRILDFFLNGTPSTEGIEFFKKHFISKATGKTNVKKIKKMIALLNETMSFEKESQVPVVGIVPEDFDFKFEVTESDLLALNIILNGNFRRLIRIAGENNIERKDIEKENNSVK